MIYRLDRATNRVVPCEETDFKSKNILERQHIEKWIENYPDILGEELLVITSEYDKFDKTNERLDVLAIDKDGNLVVIELKRDDSGKHADLQAIRYAAYCSNFRLEKICQLYKEYSTKRGKELSDEQASDEILAFIENEDFEEINDRPRIILVARQFRTEVTSSVLWLRNFEVDISCVKFTPYDMGKEEIAFESNIIIPLPEARDFIVEAERKENRTVTVTQTKYVEFYKELLERLRDRVTHAHSFSQPKPQHGGMYQIPTGIGGVHYEWAFHGQPRSSFEVGLHFEKANIEMNLEFLSQLESKLPELEKALHEPLIVEQEWKKRLARLYVTKTESQFTEELKAWAADKMAVLIETLQPALDEME